MVQSYQNSNFYNFMESSKDRKTYFDEMWGNHGDGLILRGAKHVFSKAGCKLVDSPENADQIVINGGGLMVDVYQTDFKKFVDYRTQYPLTTLIMAPSTFRFRGIDFKKICNISTFSPFILFARDETSAKCVKEIDLPEHCQVHISQDLAFELYDSEFIADILKDCSEKHIVISMRKDKEGFAKLLTRTKGTWLPKQLRAPLSWLRDRLVTSISQNTIQNILKQENVSEDLPHICRDVATSLTFDGFIGIIRDASVVITNRLHVGILGHMLNKRVIIICSGEYHNHKIKGVYDLSMDVLGSRTSLCLTDQ